MEEFSNVLAKMAREGNTLSGFIREGFDHDSFQVITKNNPLKVENCHISFIGHCTVEEIVIGRSVTTATNVYYVPCLRLEIP